MQIFRCFSESLKIIGFWWNRIFVSLWSLSQRVGQEWGQNITQAKVFSHLIDITTPTLSHAHCCLSIKRSWSQRSHHTNSTTTEPSASFRSLKRLFSSLWVSCTGSASDWCTLEEALYKCIDTLQYNYTLLPSIFAPLWKSNSSCILTTLESSSYMLTTFYPLP